MADQCLASVDSGFFLTTHLLALTTFFLLLAGVTWAGRRAHRRQRGRKFDRGVGLAGLLAWIGVNAYWMSPRVFRWETSLPLHVCDLAALAAPLAILTGWRPCRAIAYFWGIGLSTQGFITPVTQHGPEHPEFWMHWINHGAIVGLALYDILVCRFRPGARDLLLATVIGLVYVGIILPFDVVTGFNYGYFGKSTPEAATLIDHLGPWPLRVLWLVGLGIGAMLIALLPWVLWRAWAESDQPSRKANF